MKQTGVFSIALIIAGILTVGMLNFYPVYSTEKSEIKPIGTIYIRSNGTIQPDIAPISTRAHEHHQKLDVRSYINNHSSHINSLLYDKKAKDKNLNIKSQPRVH